MKQVSQFFIDYWPVLAPVLWELVVRLKPTDKSLSLLTLVFRILNNLFPDKNKTGGTHIIILLMMTLPFMAFGQNNMQGRAMYSWDAATAADTTGIKSVLTSYQTGYGDAGGLYYNKFSHKWRVWDHTCPDTSQHKGCWTDLVMSNSKVPALPLNNFVFGTGTGIGVHTTKFTGDENAFVIMSQTPPTVTGTGINNVFVFGEGMTVHGSPALGGTVTDAGMFGIGHTIGDNNGSFSGASSFSYGNTNFNYSISGMAGGENSRTLYNNIDRGSFAVGLTTSLSGPEPVSAYANALNISNNTGAQTVGHGANGALSAIIGGKNHNVPSTAPNTFIAGGDKIKVAANDSNYVYIPRLRMYQGLNAATPSITSRMNILGTENGYVENSTSLSFTGTEMDLGNFAGGEYTAFTRNTIFGNTISAQPFTLSAQGGPLNLAGTSIVLNPLGPVPTTDNTQTHLLVRDATGGTIKLRDASSLTTAPAGSNTQVQFNNSGAFGASSDFTFLPNVSTTHYIQLDGQFDLGYSNTNASVPTTFGGLKPDTPAQSMGISGPYGTVGTPSPTGKLTIAGGSSYDVGNTNATDLTLASGVGHGTGTNGNVNVNLDPTARGAHTGSFNVNGGDVNISTTGIGAINIGNNASTGPITMTTSSFNSITVTNGSGGSININDSGATTGLTISDNDIEMFGINGDIFATGTATLFTATTHNYPYNVASATGGNIPQAFDGSATLDFPNTTTGVSDLTLTVTGAAIGDRCVTGIPNGSVTTTASFWCWVSAPNTVTIRFSPKAIGGENPASGTFTATVFKKQ